MNDVGAIKPSEVAERAGGANRKVLVLLPDFRTIGGVANYYQVLDLPRHDSRVEYMVVNSTIRETPFALLGRMIRNYRRFDRKLRSGEYGLVVINPSLNPRSYYRDAAFCWLALRRKQRTLVFFRGWAESMEHKVRRRLWDRLLFRQSFARVRDFVVLGRTFQQRLLKMGCCPQSRVWIETTVADSSYLDAFAISDRLHARVPLRILFISRLVPSKGAAIAIQTTSTPRRRTRAAKSTPKTTTMASVPRGCDSSIGNSSTVSYYRCRRVKPSMGRHASRVAARP